MVGQNYFIAVSGRVLCKPKTRYFIGYLIDKETEKHRFDMVVSEKKSIQNDSFVSKSTVKKYKIFSLAKKEHIKGFQKKAVEEFNRQNSKYGYKYYNFKKMMLGMFASAIEEKGFNISDIDLNNINYILGEVK
jgi:hypothetical protein